MVVPARQRFTFLDYVLFEAESTTRHEFLDGLVWAMAGGSPDHARIIANATTMLSVGVAGRRCAVHTADLRIRVKATGLATYPDISVICDQIELDPEDTKRHTALNPKLLVEVLSPSTEDYDRGEKLDHYKQIMSLQEVLLVDHDRQRIVVWRRDGATWSSTEHLDGAIQLAIGCEISVADVYRNPLA